MHQNPLSATQQLSYKPLLFVFLTIFFTVYGQVVIKWQLSHATSIPDHFSSAGLYLFSLLLNPWIFSGLCSAFLASLTWMLAMSKLPLSYAYPFMSLAFPITIGLSVLFFNEAITVYKMLGCLLILSGVLIISKHL